MKTERFDCRGRRGNWKERISKKDVKRDAIPRFKNLGKWENMRLVVIKGDNFKGLLFGQWRKQFQFKTLWIWGIRNVEFKEFEYTNCTVQ